jgi:hypothetical protein
MEPLVFLCPYTGKVHRTDGGGLMFGSRDSQFYQLFEASAANVAEAAEALLQLTKEPENRERITMELENLEHKGDGLTHDIIAELNRAFITPIDREDIFQIAKETDNILDAIEATAHRYIMFEITETNEAAEQLAAMIVASSGELVRIMHWMRKIKHMTNECIVEINRIEDDGDKIYRKAVKELYKNHSEPVRIIQWREIYDHLEDTLDALEDVANVVEGIAMKHS